MSFAMLYNIEDATAIAAWAATTNGLTQQERQYAQRLWNGGMSAWATAPVVAPAYQQGDPDTRGIVIDGSQVSKQLTMDFLRSIAAHVPGAAYMGAIADDMRTSCLEPPPADLFG